MAPPCELRESSSTGLDARQHKSDVTEKAVVSCNTPTKPRTEINGGSKAIKPKEVNEQDAVSVIRL